MKKRIRKLLEVIGFVPKLVFHIIWISPLKHRAVNDWTTKRLIEFGVLEWHDAPHLHSWLIHRRIDLDYWLMK